jgi:hypothetical protein
MRVARSLAAVLLLAACRENASDVAPGSGGFPGTATGGAVSLEPRQLPGFEIRLPHDLLIPPDLSYGSDRLDHAGNGRGLSLYWESGEPLTADELRGAMTALGSLETRSERVFTVGAAAEPTTSIHLGQGGKELFASTWRCGRRNFTLISTVETLHRQLLATFVCKPATDEATLLAAPLAIALPLPKDFGLASAEESSVEFHGLGNRYLLFSRTAVDSRQLATIPPEGMRSILQAMLTASGDEVTLSPSPEQQSGPHGQRTLWRGSGTSDGEPYRMLLTLFPCNTGRAALVATYTVDADTDPATGRDLLLAARCATQPQPYPSAEAIFAAACAAGDQRGCSTDE